MRSTFGYNLKNIVVASFFSSLIAGAICILTDTVTANTAAALIATSVNRATKADRLPIPTRAQHPTPRRAAAPKHTAPGCEPAFSPFADPGRSDLVNYCVT